MDREELIDEIIKLEWPMFSSVKNAGGVASCQLKPETFRIMRSSQHNTWNDALLKSYYNDLREATENGRNLMTEKYARMMERTFPDEYEKIKETLPPLDAETCGLIDEIVGVHLDWKENLDSRYPNLSDRGRPLRSVQDAFGMPSVETYMRAELQTLSPATIHLYHAETMRKQRQGISEAEENLLNQVRQYGYKSLEEANSRLSR